MGFSENLKIELQFVGIPVKELAARTGIKKKTLDSYLGANPYTPSAPVAVSIAKALGVSVEYLVEGTEGGESRPLSSLPQDIQEIVQAAAQLSPKSRKLVIRLVKVMKEQEDEGRG